MDMDKKPSPPLCPAYHPCQPGYARAGRHYIQLDYSADCRLGSYISEIFEVQHPKTNTIHIIPDGCNDIVIAYNGARVSGWLSPSIQHASRFHFERAEWIFGIRFLPGATYAIFHDSPAYSGEAAVDIQRLAPEFKRWEDKLCQSQSFVKRHELITDFLTGRIAAHDGIEAILRFCICQLIASRGLISMEALSRRAGYSGRYIRQLFTSHVGHTPKELGNIIRMQCAIRHIQENPEACSLGELADLFGFSDQSHMNREFRRFLGLTSGAVKDCSHWIEYLNPSSVRNFNSGSV